MTVGKICCREVDLARKRESVRVAANRLAARGVGTLVVVDEARRPVGILTDRDIVVRVVGLGRDPEVVTVGDAMSRDPAVVREDTAIEAALDHMRLHGVRRLPVVAANGRLVGILSLDDVLELLIEEFGSMGGILRSSLSERVASR